jgi:hypothetical protein
VKVTYLSGMIQHLLQHPDIVKVETLADAGIEGPDWHPSWLRVLTVGGGSIVLSVVATAGDGDDSAKPDHFDPGDLDGQRQRQVSGVQGDRVG